MHACIPSFHNTYLANIFEAINYMPTCVVSTGERVENKAEKVLLPYFSNEETDALGSLVSSQSQMKTCQAWNLVW